MKVKPCHDRKTGNLNGNIYFQDPATKAIIELSTQTQWQRNQIIHQFNGDYENPTLSPAVLILDGKDVGSAPDIDLHSANLINHFVIQEGNIRYFEDSTHHLKGRTVPLPDLKP